MIRIAFTSLFALAAATSFAHAADWSLQPLPSFLTHGPADAGGVHYSVGVSRLFESNTVGGLSTANGAFELEGEAAGTFTRRAGILQGSQLGLVLLVDTPSDSLGSNTSAVYGNLAPGGTFNTGIGGALRFRTARYGNGFGYAGFGGIDAFVDGGLMNSGFSGSFAGQSIDTRFTQAFLTVGLEAYVTPHVAVTGSYRTYSSVIGAENPVAAKGSAWKLGGKYDF